MPSSYPSAYSVLASACQRDAARPRLTWYDNGTGERAELSGATLLNWVHKTANFLIEELGLEPGVSISLQLPRHWLTASWWLAAHAVGAQPHISPPGSVPPSENFEVAVFGPEAIPHFSQPDLSPATPSLGPQGVEHRVAVALTPMASGFASPLPAGMTDFELEVRNQPDAFVGNDEGDPAPARAALDLARSWSLTSSDRLMAAGALQDEDDLVRDLLAPLAGDASCVWIRNPDPDTDVQHAVAEHVTVTTMSAVELPAPIRYLT